MSRRAKHIKNVPTKKLWMELILVLRTLWVQLVFASHSYRMATTSSTQSVLSTNDQLHPEYPKHQ